MPDGLAAAINDAYADRSPSLLIANVKTAVSRHLEAADPSAVVHHTEYFNNSLAPDIILQWPKESRNRHVFLRPTSNTRWVQ
jgi:hypothetical protein